MICPGCNVQLTVENLLRVHHPDPHCSWWLQQLKEEYTKQAKKPN